MPMSAFGIKRHADCADECPHSEVKRTWLKDGVMSAYDPKRTFIVSMVRLVSIRDAHRSDHPKLLTQQLHRRNMTCRALRPIPSA
jgi:hypothetical protein